MYVFSRKGVPWWLSEGFGFFVLVFFALEKKSREYYVISLNSSLLV